MTQSNKSRILKKVVEKELKGAITTAQQTNQREVKMPVFKFMTKENK